MRAPKSKDRLKLAFACAETGDTELLSLMQAKKDHVQAPYPSEDRLAYKAFNLDIPTKKNDLMGEILKQADLYFKTEENCQSLKNSEGFVPVIQGFIEKISEITTLFLIEERTKIEINLGENQTNSLFINGVRTEADINQTMEYYTSILDSFVKDFVKELRTILQTILDQNSDPESFIKKLQETIEEKIRQNLVDASILGSSMNETSALRTYINTPKANIEDYLELISQKPAEIQAILAGKDAVLRSFIKDPLSLTITDRSSNTLAHHAAFHGQFEMFQFLVKEGDYLLRLPNKKGILPINVQNNDGNSLLHLAVHEGNLERVDVLLELGAKTTLANAQGNLPLNQLTHHGSLILEATYGNSDSEENLARFKKYLGHQIDIALRNQQNQNILDIFYNPTNNLVSSADKDKVAKYLRALATALSEKMIDRFWQNCLSKIQKELASLPPESKLPNDKVNIKNCLIDLQKILSSYLRDSLVPKIEKEWATGTKWYRSDRAEKRFHERWGNVNALLEKLQESMLQNDPSIIFDYISEITNRSNAHSDWGLFKGSQLYKQLSDVLKKYSDYSKDSNWQEVRNRVVITDAEEQARMQAFQTFSTNNRSLFSTNSTDITESVAVENDTSSLGNVEQILTGDQNMMGTEQAEQQQESDARLKSLEENQTGFITRLANFEATQADLVTGQADLVTGQADLKRGQAESREDLKAVDSRLNTLEDGQLEVRKSQAEMQKGQDQMNMMLQEILRKFSLLNPQQNRQATPPEEASQKEESSNSLSQGPNIHKQAQTGENTQEKLKNG